MVVKHLCFECERCGYETNVKCNLINHLTKKKECEPIFSNKNRDALVLVLKTAAVAKQEKIKVEHICGVCSKEYANAWNLKRHMATCKEDCENSGPAANREDEYMSLIRSLQDEVKLLKQHIVLGDGGINHFRQPNIIVYGDAASSNKAAAVGQRLIGNENIKYIIESPNYDKLMDSFMQSPDGVLEYLMLQNMHPDHPENHTVKKVNATVCDENDEVMFIHPKREKGLQRMSALEWLSSYARDSFMPVFNYASGLFNCAKQKARIHYMKENGLSCDHIIENGDYPDFAPQDEDIKKKFIDFHLNCVLPLDYDIGMNYDNIDTSGVNNKQKEIAVKLLRYMPQVKDKYRKTDA